MTMPVLPLTDNIQKCCKLPDCLLGIVTQPTDSRLSETNYVVSYLGLTLIVPVYTCILYPQYMLIFPLLYFILAPLKKGLALPFPQ